MKITNFHIAGLLAVLIVCFASYNVFAATLDSSTELSSGTVDIPLEGGSQNVTGKDPSGYWDFGDKNANGTNDDPVDPPGLDMGSYYLRHQPEWGADSIDLKFNLNGGNITSDGGYFSTHCYLETGDIFIENVGDISMGDGFIRTRRLHVNQNGRNMGHVHIGTEGNPAGDVQVASIKTYLYASEYTTGIAGDILIYSTGDVLIQDGSGVAGDLITGTLPEYSTDVKSHIQSGWIRIKHNGTFVADLINARAYVAKDAVDSHGFEADGAVSGGTPTGSFQAGLIDTQCGWEYDHGWDYAGSVTIRNYSTVTVGTIDAGIDAPDNDTAYDTAQNITVTNITGDITITNTASASHPSMFSEGETSRGGVVNLQCGGSIEMGTLDLSQLERIDFDPGSSAQILGLIKGTDGSALSGNGSSLSNGGRMRLRAGKALYYIPEENPALQEGSYALADLSGNAGDGGILTPYVQPGTVIVVQ